MVWQKPISLLWFRGVLNVLNFALSVDATSYCVVVLPELPVMATTVGLSFLRL